MALAADSALSRLRQRHLASMPAGESISTVYRTQFDRANSQFDQRNEPMPRFVLRCTDRSELAETPLLYLNLGVWVGGYGERRPYPAGKQPRLPISECKPEPPASST